MNPHLTLAARIQTEPPSRELDGLAAVALGWKRSLIGDESRGYFVPRQEHWTSPEEQKIATHYPITQPDPPPLTSSLDAAISAIPEGWRVYFLADQRHFRINHGWHAGIDRYVPPFKGYDTAGNSQDMASASAPTAPQALMIAILMAMGGEQG